MLSLTGYIYNGSLIWLLILVWLSIYLILTFWVFIYKFISLKGSVAREKESLSSIINLQSHVPTSDKIFANVKTRASRELLLIWKTQVNKKSTSGLVALSIIASTSPFVGLFGTVVEILDAFSKLGGSTGASSLDIIAPVISQALVATAAGILVAIPAYSFFLILKRRAFDWMTIVTIQTDILNSDKTPQGMNIE
ncbi:MAG: MotA/TolQ/ExbB proton channel family protein [Helicobacter sp.]|nr:MotA/TolQ/ExbB proton channel family protein [Helicobacter sp.]